MRDQVISPGAKSIVMGFFFSDFPHQPEVSFDTLFEQDLLTFPKEYLVWEPFERYSADQVLYFMENLARQIDRTFS